MGNNDLQNMTNKIKDRLTRPSLKTTERKCVQGVCRMSHLLPTPDMHRGGSLGKVDGR